MLPIEVVAEVQRLLECGQHSQRQIALLVGVSRGTVHAIATGKRGLHGREGSPATQPVEAVPERCPGCGTRVYLPCILCRARAYHDRRTHFSADTLPHGIPRRVA